MVEEFFRNDYDIIPTDCFESIKIANETDHIVNVRIQRQDKIDILMMVCPEEHNVIYSIENTINNSIEIRIHDEEQPIMIEKNEMELCEGQVENPVKNDESNGHCSMITGEIESIDSVEKDDSNEHGGTITEKIERTNSVEKNDTDCITHQRIKIQRVDTEDKLYKEECVFRMYKPIEICSLSKRCNINQNNFFKGCKWAPDGTCILTNSNDNYLRIIDLPSDLLCKTVWKPTKNNLELNFSMNFYDGGHVYDYAWFPQINSEDGSMCFLSSSTSSPLHLWNSLTGEIKASYKPFNRFDEITHAYSLRFSGDGNRIYSGFIDEVKIFNTEIPGRQCTSWNLKSSFPKNMVSTIVENPILSKLVALGSYSKNIGFYSEGASLFLLKGHQGGVTHLEFSSDGIRLFSGGRMDSEILCWDLRNLGSVLYSLPRIVKTHQRVYFDITNSVSGFDCLFSGSTNGIVSLWSLSSSPPFSPKEETSIDPVYTFQAHADCSNGISIHPCYPIIATSSGQRHAFTHSKEEYPESVENNVKLWWFGKQ